MSSPATIGRSCSGDRRLGTRRPIVPRARCSGGLRRRLLFQGNRVGTVTHFFQLIQKDIALPSVRSGFGPCDGAIPQCSQKVTLGVITETLFRLTNKCLRLH